MPVSTEIAVSDAAVGLLSDINSAAEAFMLSFITNFVGLLDHN